MRSATGALSLGLGRMSLAPAPSARAPQQAAIGLRASGPHPDRPAGLFSPQRTLQASTQAAALAPGSNVALVDDAYSKLEGTKAGALATGGAEASPGFLWYTLAARCPASPLLSAAAEELIPRPRTAHSHPAGLPGQQPGRGGGDEPLGRQRAGRHLLWTLGGVTLLLGAGSQGCPRRAPTSGRRLRALLPGHRSGRRRGGWSLWRRPASPPTASSWIPATRATRPLASRRDWAGRSSAPPRLWHSGSALSLGISRI